MFLGSFFFTNVMVLAGDLHWKIVSVYINRLNQVRFLLILCLDSRVSSISFLSNDIIDLMNFEARKERLK